MNWISSLQKAIDYVEEHITEKIDYEKVDAIIQEKRLEFYAYIKQNIK